MTKEEAKNKILELTKASRELTPELLESDLPALEGFPDVLDYLVNL